MRTDQQGMNLLPDTVRQYPGKAIGEMILGRDFNANTFHD